VYNSTVHTAQQIQPDAAENLYLQLCGKILQKWNAMEISLHDQRLERNLGKCQAAFLNRIRKRV
jgi:hypothetical protein